MEKSIDDNTQVIAISHVQWLTGARADLKAISELAHDHGAYLVVDGIQAAGGLKIDVKKEDVDFYAAGSYTWLLGPGGAGFLYVRDDLIENIVPSVYGYRGARGGLEPKLKDTAKRLEFGEPSYLSFVGTDAAIKMFLEINAFTETFRSYQDTQRLISKALNDFIALLTTTVITGYSNRA